MALLLALVLLNGRPAQAAFDDNGAGSRAPGMADAVVGIADDVDALYYNPAGLGQMDHSELSTQYGQLLQGFTDGTNIGTSYIAIAQPLQQGQKGTVAAAFNNFRASGLYSERTLSLSYGRRLETLSKNGDFYAGSSIKQLHREFSSNAFTSNALNSAGFASDQQDPLFANHGYTKDNLSLDLGTLYRFGRGRKYGVGLMLMNLNQPDVSLAGVGDRLSVVTKLGFSYQPNWGLVTAQLRRARNLASQYDNEAALGAEHYFKVGGYGSFGLRGGYAQGSRGFQVFTAGASYLFGNAQLDYAFDFPIGNLSTLKGSQRIGLSLRWGAPPAPAAPSSPVLALPAPQAPARPKVNPTTQEIVDPELERSWAYYQQVAGEGANAHRKLEILESIVVNYGEAGARRVNAELAKIRLEVLQEDQKRRNIKN